MDGAVRSGFESPSAQALRQVCIDEQPVTKDIDRRANFLAVTRYFGYFNVAVYRCELTQIGQARQHLFQIKDYIDDKAQFWQSIVVSQKP